MNALRPLPLLLFTLCLPLTAPAAEPVMTEGRVAAVTVYQGQALVTREVSLDQAGGLTEIVVTNLPDKVQPGSLYAEPAGDVVVRSVRYRVRPVEQDVRQEVRELDTQLLNLRDKLHSNNRLRALLGERTEYLKKMEGFTTGTANAELKSGVLNAETLKSLTEFVFKERAEIAEQELASAVEERELKQQLELLQRKRNVLTQGSAKTVREAVVFADLGEAGAKSLRLTYIVSDATWSPSYNLRADSNLGRVVVEYNASIQQRSGEDWTDVAMSLSTATPSLVAAAPELETLAIRLAAPTPRQQQAQRDYFQAKGALMEQQRKLSELRNNFDARGVVFGSRNDNRVMELNDRPAAVADSMSRHSGVASGGGFGGMFAGGRLGDADLGLNRLGCAIQLFEFNNDLSRPQQGEGTSPNSQGISVSYELRGDTSLPSRSDRQLIQIASLPLEGQIYRIAMPVLTEYVYKEAMLVNGTDMVLLAGPAATFLDGEFVGRGDVPTVCSGEHLKVGLGIDTSLRASRELVKKTNRTQGGNRVQELLYRLAIENFDGEDLDIRLMDRMPKSEKDDIKITLVESDQEVSKDPEYQQTARKLGILRWDLTAGAGDSGLDATSLEYTVRLEYDKQLQIVGMAGR